MAAARIVGVHPVPAPEPVHLVEIELDPSAVSIDFGSITQSQPDRDSSYWQVAYDERPIPGSPGRWCFFFHYLDLTRPFESTLGDLPIPPETPVPDRLQLIRYEEP